jgi:hypothetical protein
MITGPTPRHLQLSHSQSSRQTLASKLVDYTLSSKLMGNSNTPTRATLLRISISSNMLARHHMMRHISHDPIPLVPTTRIQVWLTNSPTRTWAAPSATLHMLEDHLPVSAPEQLERAASNLRTEAMLPLLCPRKAQPQSANSSKLPSAIPTDTDPMRTVTRRSVPS